jgi:hypothetical protein
MEENTAAAVKQPTYYESLVEKLGGAAKCAAGVTVLEDHGSWVLLKKGGSKYCFNLDDTKAKLEAKPSLLTGDIFQVLASHDPFAASAPVEGDTILVAKQVRDLAGEERANYVATAFVLTPTDREIISTVDKHVANNYVFRYLKFVRAKAAK